MKILVIGAGGREHALCWKLKQSAQVVALYCAPGLVFCRAGLRRLIALWPFVAIIALWHLITGEITQGAEIVLRLLSAVALANLVTMTTRLTQMIDVVRWLCTPLRWLGISTHPLEIAIALVIRFTPILVDKGALLGQSWRARSAKKPGWRIVMPFTVLAIDDAEHVADALKARGGL